MKLDATDIRYISDDAFRVLAAVEQGSKNHELVPTSLIAQISGSRSGGVMKSLGVLAKRKLVAKIQNAKYEGYRLTYGGYDFLACRTFAKRDTVYSVGNQIGTGKESDIYVVADEEGTQSVMKIHRLGRISFRAIKSKRDYLRKGQSASWMYMSRLAAIKEYAFMQVLHSHGFPVPKPIDQSRHCLIMELIDAFPLRQINDVPSPGSLYSNLMDLIVRLAHSGLIHGDFNEFNILLRDHRSLKEKMRDEEKDWEREERIKREGGDFVVELEEEDFTEERKTKGVLEVVLIDFPQMVSIDHKDAEYYFNRDVSCIRTFFFRRFKYESSIYPRFAAVMKEGIRTFDLDVEVAASGFTKGDRAVLEGYMAEIAELDEEEYDDDEEEHSDDDEDDEEEEDEIDDHLSVLPSSSLTATSLAASSSASSASPSASIPSSTPTLLTAPALLSLETLHLDPSLHAADSNSDVDSHEGTEKGTNFQDNDDETASSAGRSDDGRTTVFGEKSRKRRPSTRVPAASPAEVGEIVKQRLASRKKNAERMHHGGRAATSGVLGRMKGSKMKGDVGRVIKDGQDF